MLKTNDRNKRYTQQVIKQVCFPLFIYVFIYFEQKSKTNNWSCNKINRQQQLIIGITVSEVSVMTSNNKNTKDTLSQTKDLNKDTNNTKQRSRRITKKDAGTVDKKQPKLTSYFNTVMLSNSSDTVQDLDEAKIRQLSEELEIKDKQLEKIRQQKEIIENNVSKLYMERKSFKGKNKEVLIANLCEEAQYQRLARRRVDNKLGNYDQNHFVEGELITKIRIFIQNKKDELQKFQADLKKCRSDQQKDRIKFAISFLKKQISTKQAELKKNEKVLNAYKQRLKLAHKQLNCYYANQGWPTVKDCSNVVRYQTLQLVGKGGFGQVYRCYDLQAHKYVAIKINNVTLGNDQAHRENILKHVKREVQTQIQLNHQNIVRMYEVLQINESRIVFVMQFCDGPDLAVYLKQRKCLQQKDAKKIIYQVFSALSYLSELDPKVIHYDLKPSNIIFHHGIVKILDFGLCKRMEGQESRMELTSQGVGTYWYLPPETFQYDEQPKISESLDVWSAGIILYQMLYGVRPFANDASQQKIIKHNLIQKESKKLTFPVQSPLRYKISKQVKQLIEQCLQRNPDDRISAKEACNHACFKQ